MRLDYDTLEVTLEAKLLTVALNRPAVRNAVSLELCDDLFAVEQEIAAAGDAVNAVILRANGPVFCAGADLKERQGKDENWVRERRRRAFAAYEAIRMSELPHIAVVNGPLVGSGGEIAMACDFIYASTKASFRFPEALWGTVGATQRLPRVIGPAAAKELLFTGRKMGAEEAFRLGLVQRLFEPETIETEAREVAQTIADGPGLAMRLAKRAVDIGGAVDLPNGIGVERLAIDRCLADAEWKSGLDRFNEGDRN